MISLGDVFLFLLFAAGAVPGSGAATAFASAHWRW